jgi:polysaccharide biosynthesis transport protein
MNLGLYLLVARRWVLFAILPAALVAGAQYYRTARQAKVYQATATLYIQVPNAGAPGTTDVYASQALIPTYGQIIELPAIAAAADRLMAARYPGYQLEAHGLSSGQSGLASTQPTTQLMDVSVSDTVPARAAAAADAACTAFIADITALQKERYNGGQQALQSQMNQAQANIQIVSQRITAYHGPSTGLENLKSELSAYTSIFQTLLSSEQQFNLDRNTAVKSVKLLSPSQVPTVPTGPHPLGNTFLYGFLALVVCAGLIFAYDYFDDSPRTPEEIEEIIGSPILGTVQQFDTSEYGPGFVSEKRSRSPMSEAYRIIRTNLQFTDPEHPLSAIVVTSASPKEGKSTTASNLAFVMAEAGRTVTIVDADLRRPSLHSIFGVDRRPGFTEMLVGTSELNGLGIQPTGLPSLKVVASGPMPPRPADLLAAPRLLDVVQRLRGNADMVVLDSPPLLAVTDAAIISAVTDGVVLVVDPAKSKRRDLVRAREAVEAVDGRILGVVINRLSKQGAGYYYYYYQHHYGYQEKYDYYSSDPTAAEANGSKAEPAAAEADGSKV